MAKQRAGDTREGDEKPFSGSAIISGSEGNEPHRQIRQQVHIASLVPNPLSNQMLDSLKDYLNNISVAVPQTIAKGAPLANLAVSLAISFDTVARQQQEIKRMYEHIKVLKKRSTQASSIGKMEVGELVINVVPCYAVVVRTAPHKTNSCYFHPKHMTDRR